MEDDTIRITHFINPHMFWYKPVSAYVHNLEEKRFQLAIDEYCEENFRQVDEDRVCESFPGEVRMLATMALRRRHFFPWTMNDC